MRGITEHIAICSGKYILCTLKTGRIFTKRRYGAGTMLYQAMKQTAQEMGLARVEMMVWAFNEQAMRFYKKLGLEARSTTLEEKL